MPLAVVRDIGSPRSIENAADASVYQEHLVAEFVFARAAAGMCDGTILGDVAAIEEFLGSAGVWAWEAQAQHADRFLGRSQRNKAVATRRRKANAIATFYRFLEVRYRGEIHELTGQIVSSPIDQINRPKHAGEFSVRIPPSPADLTKFFSAWRGDMAGARKWLVASRNYVMAKVTHEVGMRVSELCNLALDDLLFDRGPLGKIHIRFGKGASGSGPRQRVVPMLGDTRALLVWWVQEVRGRFDDDWEIPGSPLFPSERKGQTRPDSFRAALEQAAEAYLPGPVRTLTPHVLRHACASRLYEQTMSLAAIQELLGHRWLATTMGYVHIATETIEEEYRKAAERTSQRFRRK